MRSVFLRVSGLLTLAALLLVGNYRHMLRFDLSSNEIYEPSRKAKVPVTFRLEDIALKAGLNKPYECFTPDKTNANVLDRICRPNAAVVVADFFGDGLPSLFFNTMKEGETNHLYRNLGGDRFEDVTAGSGLDLDKNDPYPTSGALAFDYDNDGILDLLVTKLGCHRLFKGLGHGKFRDVSEETGISRICGNATAVNALDYDRDGYLDIVIGGFWEGVGMKNLQGPVWNDSIYDARTGTRPVLLHNVGGKRFEEVTEKMGLGGLHHTWAIGVSDLYRDGYPDLVFANDHGRSQILRNDHGRRFVDVSAESGIGSVGRFGMNADIGDAFNQGLPDIYISDITHPATNIWGNNLFTNFGNGKFSSNSKGMGVSACGWSWGAKFVDLNRDGWLDIFVTSGFWRGKSKSSYLYTMATISALPYFLQRDQSLHPPADKFSNSDDNANCVFVQTAVHDLHNRFTDVAETVGAGQAILGKGVAVLDVDNSGTQSILVASSQDRPYLYKNTVLDHSHWLGLKLVGTKSNRDAWGALVTLEATQTKQSRELYPGNGFKSESDSRIFFGLGTDTRVKELKIRWPSGLVQEIHDPKIDRYTTIMEPAAGGSVSMSSP